MTYDMLPEEKKHRVARKAEKRGMLIEDGTEIVLSQLGNDLGFGKGTQVKTWKGRRFWKDSNALRDGFIRVRKEGNRNLTIYWAALWKPKAQP